MIFFSQSTILIKDNLILAKGPKHIGAWRVFVLLATYFLVDGVAYVRYTIFCVTRCSWSDNVSQSLSQWPFSALTDVTRRSKEEDEEDEEDKEGEEEQKEEDVKDLF